MEFVVISSKSVWVSQLVLSRCSSGSLPAGSSGSSYSDHTKQVILVGLILLPP